MTTRHIQFFLYAALLFFVPLVFFHKTSELFEFNKLILLYTSTALITSVWLIDSLSQKRILVTRSRLFWVFSIFLLTQTISTVFSIDPRTSFFGYYSRWNGGLLSLFSYFMLFVVAQTYFTRRDMANLFIAGIVSTIIVSVWATLEHFGASPSCYLIRGTFDVSCWVQDVQNRVFATFGQPNWLAAWLAALIPITQVTAYKTNIKIYQVLSVLLSVFFFMALLFTKSRSGIIAIIISEILLTGAAFIYKRQSLYVSSVIGTLFILAAVVFGTPWSPPLIGASQQSTPENKLVTSYSDPGGTESGAIRQIVWAGALNTWIQYPIIGSGLETFGLSYYLGRPMIHNQTSEWNFLYNKAHNEYLNTLTTTGVLGLISYLLLIGTVIHGFYKDILRAKNTSERFITLAFASSFLTILVTNFFGFSVVAVSCVFYLIIASNTNTQLQGTRIRNLSIIRALPVILGLVIVIYMVHGYYKADLHYALGISELDEGSYESSLNNLTQALLYSNEPLYRAELARLYVTVAKELPESELEARATLTTLAQKEADQVRMSSPNHVKLLKALANVYATLADFNPQYEEKSLEVLKEIEVRAPTDPSVRYQRGLMYAKQGLIDMAILEIKVATQMKPDYKIARRLLAFLYKEVGQIEEARQELQYILTKISPDDSLILDELKKLDEKDGN